MTIKTQRGNRTFDVTRNERGDYILTGKRGAAYIAIRFREHPERLFLSSVTSVDPLGADVVLTDANGTLEQLDTFGSAVWV